MTDKNNGSKISGQQTGQEEISDRLKEAIDGLRKDVTRVEIWATALGTFVQPVPDYRPNSSFVLGSDAEKSTKKPDEKS